MQLYLQGKIDTTPMNHSSLAGKEIIELEMKRFHADTSWSTDFYVLQI